ncbi:MAG: hypothetical protein ACKO5E_06275 [bacterium]
MPRLKHLTVAIMAILPGMLFSSAVAAQELKLERLEAGLPLNDSNVLKIGRFNPIRAELTTGDKEFSGMVRFATEDPDGIETRFEVPVRLGPFQSSVVTGLVSPGQLMPRITARLIAENGRDTGLGAEISLEKLRVIDAAVRVTGVMGYPAGVEQLPNMPGLTTNPRTNEKSLLVVPVQAKDLPGRVESLEMLDDLVIDTSNPQVLESIDAGRAEAIKVWVRDGGHLVIVAASQRQALMDSSLKSILPAIPAGSVRSFDLGAIESLVGSRNPIVGTGKSLTVTKFDEIAQRGGVVIDTASSTPLLIRGAYGFGRVTLIGLDVNDGPFAVWKDRTLFWARALEVRRQVQEETKNTGNNPLTAAGGGFYQAGAGDIASLLRSAIDQFTGVRVVGFGLVISLILLYLVAIGPGDFLLVKYILKRPELTWVTFPLLVVAVTGVVYVMTYRFKGSDLRVNKIDVVDIDYISQTSRGWSGATVFSPVNADYTIGFTPVKSGAEQSLAAGEAADDPTMLYQSTSWFDSPDATLGGSGRPATLNLAATAYRFGGKSGSSRLENLRIPIWSTKSLEGRWMKPGLALNPVRSSITRTGTDRVTGRITNLLAEPLEDTILVYQQQVYDLGKIEPGASVLVNPTKTQNLTGYLDRYSAGELQFAGNTWADRAKVKLPRLMMFHQSGPASLRAMENGPLSRLDLSSLLPLNRPILVANVGKSSSQLVLGGISGHENAKVSQTSLVRCLLPLEAGNATSMRVDKQYLSDIVLNDSASDE